MVCFISITNPAVYCLEIAFYHELNDVGIIGIMFTLRDHHVTPVPRSSESIDAPEMSWFNISLPGLSIQSIKLLGAVHILRNTGWGGRGLPDLLQYYIGGVSPIYYNIT